MRLAVLFHRLGPYHVARLKAANAAGRGEVVAVELSGGGGEYAWEAVAADGFERVTVCPAGDSNALPRAELAARVVAALDRVRPDALAVAGWADRGMLLAARWGLRRRVPMVLMSDSQAHDERRVWWKEAVKRRVVGAFGAGFVAGTPHAAYLQRLGMSADRIAVGYDVVDNDHFAAGAAAARADPGARGRLGLPDRYFLCCARLVAKKDVGGLLAGFAAYRRAAGADGWGLVVVGDGPLRAGLAARAAELGVADAVRWAGFRQYPELPAYYGLASALVLASRPPEQWGLVVNEGMAAGLPVVVSDACGCGPDLVADGATGWVVPAGDPAAVADRLARLAADPAGAAAMGEAGRRRVAGWGLGRFAAGLWDAAGLARPRAARPAAAVVLRALTR